MRIPPDAIAEASPDLLVVLDPRDLRVLQATQRVSSLGLTRTQLVGRSLIELIPGATPELFERARTGRHDPHPDVPLRVSIRHADGAVLPVDVRVARLHDDDVHSPLVASLRLLSERARAAERELVSALGAVPAAIVTWKLDGTIMSWNPAAQRLFGYAPDVAIGQHIHLIVPWADRAGFDASVARLLASDGHFTQHEVLRSRVDGELPVEENLFLIRDVAWQPVRVGGHFRDVAELMRLRRATELLGRAGRSGMRADDDAAGVALLGAGIAPVVDALRVAATADAGPVLIVGETGVGKRELARTLHAHSTRHERPFLEVDCATLDPLHAESELFGHERGAFVGADAQKMGLLEVADGGTLLFDHVDHLPQPLQVQLLAFLDDGGSFRRVGGVKRLHASVRIVCTTDADLAPLVEQGRFRRDLALRLQAHCFLVPPLRDRKDDIPLLVRALLAAARPGRTADVDDDALALLVGHGWPGNVRELEGVVERALIVAGDSARLQARHLAVGPGAPAAALVPALVQSAPGRRRRSRKLDDVVQEHIEAVVRETDGNLVRAAALLGIDRSTLRRKLRAGHDAGEPGTTSGSGAA